MVMAVVLATGGTAVFAAGKSSLQGTWQGEIRAKAPQQNETSGVKNEDQEQQNGSEMGRESSTEITQEQAAQIALSDAKLTEEELTGFRIKTDWDDGRVIYEVEMYIDEQEYSYEIDADTGRILESDYEVDEEYNDVPKDADALTRKEAAEIILKKVEGATEKDIRIKYEWDDGHEIYEGDLVYDGKEYEFELHAKSGVLLEWSEERY